MGKLEVCEVCLGVEQVSICEFGVHNVIDQLWEQFAHKNVGITCFFISKHPIIGKVFYDASEYCS